MDFDLYALSNGNADIQRVGLGHLFKQHFSAAGVGAAKPDPRMFQAALDRIRP
jgi:HAD superfamily hydrolase (TIGR01549 family)